MRSVIKLWLLTIIVLPTLALAAAGQNAATANAKAANQPVDINKVSYSIGYTMGSNIAKQFTDLDIKQLLSGFQSGLSGGTAKYNRQEMQQLLVQYQRQAMQKRMEKFRKDSEANKKAGNDFLTKNKAQQGVVTLDSGLQYKVIQTGKGDKPVDGATVKVTYTGKLINGDVFDSNEDASNPATFNIARVIPGWREALKLMQPGATWEIYVPSTLAYGQRGTAGKIGPNEALIFKVHLISWEKPTAAEKNAANKPQSFNKQRFNRKRNAS